MGLQPDPNDPNKLIYVPDGPTGGTQPKADDPYDPTYGNGDQRVALLQANGYRWTQGNGPNAIWLAPTGQPVSEVDALERLQRVGSGVAAGTSPVYREVGGVTYERQPDGSFAPARGLPADAQGGGMTAGQSADIAARNAALQETIRMNSANIERYGRQDALAQQQQAWLQQKETLARADRKEEVAQQTATQIAGIQTQRDRLSLDTQVAQQQAMQAQRTLDFNIASANQQGQQRNAEFNATQQLATQKLNTDAAAQKRRDISDENAKIGQLGQDTGNRGRFAAFAAANKGWGADNTAIGSGTSLIDDASVQPLEGALANKAALEAQPDNPYGFKPIAFNPLGAGAGGALTDQYVTDPRNGARYVVNDQNREGLKRAFEYVGTPYADVGRALGTADSISGGAAAPPTGVDMSDAAMQQRITAARAAGSGAGGQGVNGQPAFLPQMEHGGMVQGAFMAGDDSDGEENPEIVIPLGEGGAMVVSVKGMKPEKIKALKAKMQKFATGGLFDQLGDSAKLSKGFLADASKKFREGTPWAGMPGALPSPVYGSSPGFNPLLNQVLASGRALEQGLPAEYSNWLTERYKPATIRGINGVGRSG